jgi:hypothetical protein
VDFGSRQFIRLNKPYPTPDTTAYYPAAPAYPLGIFPDGSPVMFHTYSYQVFDPEAKRYWVLRGNTENSSTPSNTVDLANAHGFSLTGLDWRRSRVAQDTKGNTAFHSGGKSCYDSIRKCFWSIPPGVSGQTDSRFSLFKFSNMETPNGDGTYGTWTRYPLYTPGDIDAVLHHDPVDDLLIFNDWRQAAKRIYYYPLSQLGSSPTSLPFITQGGSIPADQSPGGGWDWSTGLNAMIYIPYNGGPNLYKCSKPATAYQTNAWNWSLITSPTNTQAVPTGPLTVDIYTRLRIAKFADMELAICVTRNDQPAYAMRIL